MNERDTHFAGFAKLLWDELLHVHEFGYIEVSDDEEEENVQYQEIIARRAYDLARHFVWHAMGGTENAITIIVADVPDMTEWPVEPVS